MKKLYLKFTLNGHKNTYFKRLDIYGEPVTTLNKDGARKIKEKDASDIIKLLVNHYGKDNISDIEKIEDDA